MRWWVPLLFCLACSVDRGALGFAPARDAGAADGGVDASADAGADAGPADAGPMDAGPCDGGPPAELVRLGFEDVTPPEGSDVVVSEGALELALQPHRLGVLRVTAFEGVVLDTEDPALADLSGATPTGQAYLHDLDEYYSGVIRGLGLEAGDDQFTLLYEGEIFLEAGTQRLVLDVDDVGVVEIDLDGSVARVVAPGPFEDGVGELEVPRDGWYPIAMSYADEGGPGGLTLRIGPEGAEEVVARRRLRVRPESLGRELFAFVMTTPDGMPWARRLDPRGSDLDFGRDDPGDVGFAGSDLWSARWIGRVRLPAPRATIRVRSDDGHRLWVDGVFVGGGYDPEPMDESYPLSLAEGWHDVILELSEHSLDAFARLTLDDGTAFAPEDMRPRTRFGGDVFAKAATPQQSVGPGSTGSATLPLVLGGTAGPEAVELSAVITATAEPEGISLRVDAPDGREYVVDVDAIGRRVAGTDVWRMRRVLTGDGLPTAVAGGWRFTVQNTGDETVRFERAGVLAHVAADPSPYPVEGVYEAEPLDLGAPRTITGAFADVDLARDAEVVVAVRAAADTAALERATWVTADDTGALPMALRGSVVQLRLTLRGPGWETPRVRSVSVRGTSCP